MANGTICIERVLQKLDLHLHANDYLSAERHLVYWLEEAQMVRDVRAELFVLNELMGLYRKTGKRDEALECANRALSSADAGGIGEITVATTYINAATVYKAFSMPEQSLPLFAKAKEIYERELDIRDARLGGLYNNMGLSFADLSLFDESEESYNKAISVMENIPDSEGEIAITYLNLATMVEKKYGLVDGDEKIREYLNRAESLLDRHSARDGYYAFVCEKCATVFGYYGRFVYEKKLAERAREIYERERLGKVE